MLPKEVERTITVYPRWISPQGRVYLLRRVLHKCSWEERNVETALRTGQVVEDMTLIRVFDKTSGLKWVSPHVWHKENPVINDKIWTADIFISPSTLIVPFETPHEFDADGYATTGLATTAENTFARLPKNTGTTRPVEVNNNTNRLGGHVRMRCGRRI